VTSRQIWDRLQKELQHNVALRVKETDEDGIFEVAGRGELHLTILLENMRREGYELAVSSRACCFATSTVNATSRSSWSPPTSKKTTRAA
jgi:GTP-binding protein